MLEYLSPILLPLLDPTAPRLRWRTICDPIRLVEGKVTFDKASYPFAVANAAIHWLAVSSQVRDYLVCGLATDGCQYEGIGSEAPFQVTSEHHLELSTFLVPSNTTEEEELNVS